MKEKVVLIFSAYGANDSLRGLMVDYGDALTETGLSVLHVDSEEEHAELRYAVNLMASGKVAFAMSWLGIVQDLSETSPASSQSINLFQRYGVPLVKLQGDLPAYFPERHRDVPLNCINLYQAMEFVEFRRRYLPEARALASLLPPMPMVPMAREDVNVKARRRGQLVFVKNGNSSTQLRDMWRTRLPPSTARLALRMSEAIRDPGLGAGPFLIGQFIERFLQAEGFDGDIPNDIVHFFAAQMDDFLRREKSTMIAEAILDLPVIVLGGSWGHVDFIGKRARLADGMDVDATNTMLAGQLGTIDMSANVDTWPHDRVQRAAGSYALVLTNRQSWLDQCMPGFDDFTFEFSAESIKARVSDAIAHPDRYIEQAISFGEAFRESFPRSAFAEKITSLVDLVALMSSDPKPELQPFYVWPNDR